ncbi:MAG: SDR family NAD(P)-dependent oxidoreductase [Flavisolibacter sp.]
MEQKRIIIVGASSGIGKELVLIYAAKGYKIGITGRRKQLLEDLKEKFPGQITVCCFDVMGQENLPKIKELISHLGGLDLIIYNAGIGLPQKNLEVDKEIITTRTNVNGFVEIVGFAFTHFVQQGHGQIALTSSVAAIRGNGQSPAYSASKAYMSIYAEGLTIKARRLSKPIVITDIRPGFVDSHMAKGAGRFWEAPTHKAAYQIARAIEKKKRIAYITKRWEFIAFVMKLMPFQLYKRMA